VRNNILKGNVILREASGAIGAVEATLQAGGEDRVIQGHVHDYERVLHVFNGVAMATNDSNPPAPVHVVDGAASNREKNDIAPARKPWEPTPGASTARVR